MKNFHIKSLILGIGIGVVLTSIISLIYTAGIVNYKMSNQEIIDQAKKLGMVENTQIIKDSSNSPEPTVETSKAASIFKPKEDKATSQQSTKLDVPAQTEKSVTADQVVKISVNPGDSSEAVAERLVKEGLIPDKAAFVKELGDMGLTSEINIGEFKIKKGSEMKAIIKIITGVN